MLVKRDGAIRRIACAEASMRDAGVDLLGGQVPEARAPDQQAAVTSARPSSSGFRHWMTLYGGIDEFVSTGARFLREGLARDEQALVVVPRTKIDALRRELADDARRVQFEDMEDVGRNPARIIPAWSDFVERNASPGRGVRGIGEPINSERRPAELVECQLHEALINVAFADTTDFTLLCPYDASALPAPVIEEAFRSHPTVHVHGSESPSRTYHEGNAQDRLAAAALPMHPTPSWSMAVGSYEDLAAVRARVSGAATEFGLDEARSQAFVLVVHETAANTIAHGGGTGFVACWREKGSLVVEVENRGSFALADQPLVGRVRPGWEQDRGRGLWLANQLADLVQVRTTGDETAVRIAMRR
jgi:anti-sigma regulatory factor (Ser/Thr protein kinase)